MRTESGLKWLTAGRLIELLSELPKDTPVVANLVGNLTILSENCDTFMGFIDFVADGTVERPGL